MLSPSCTVYVCVYVRARVRAAVSMLCLPDAHEGVGALSQRLRFMLMMETERIDLGVLEGRQAPPVFFEGSLQRVSRFGRGGPRG